MMTEIQTWLGKVEACLYMPDAGSSCEAWNGTVKKTGRINTRQSGELRALTETCISLPIETGA